MWSMIITWKTLDYRYDNEAPQTGVFKNYWIILWVITP